MSSSISTDEIEDSSFDVSSSDFIPSPSSSRMSRSRLAVRPSMLSAMKMESIGTDTEALLSGTEKLDYDQMCQVVTTSPKLLSLLFNNRAMSPGDTDSLAASLTKVAKEINSTVIMFESLLKLEFEKASKTETADVNLRGNSLFTKCMDQFIQNYALHYLKSILEDPLSELLGSDEIDLEVDRSRIKFTVDEEQIDQAVKEHMELLKEYTNKFLTAITSPYAVLNLPFEAKFSAYMISKLCQDHVFTQDRIPMIGSFIILRLFNPAIVQPDRRNVIPPTTKIPPSHHRNLVLISKVIQNLSNQMDFGVKEEYMTPMNEFIEQHQQQVNHYLENVCITSQDYDDMRGSMQQFILENTRTKKVIGHSQDLTNEAMNIQFLMDKNANKMKSLLDEHSFIQANELDSFMVRLPPLHSIEPNTHSLPSHGDHSIASPTSPESEHYASDDKTYLKFLEKAKSNTYEDLEAMQLLAIRGKDAQGRPIVVLTEDRIRKEDLDRVILFIVKKLDKVVENDYVVIWCVNNSPNQQRPGLSWLLNVYKSLARKYKKNLKRFYMVHPSFMFKLLIKCFRPFVSEKFWKKLVMADRVNDIFKDGVIEKDNVPLAPNVLSYDYISSTSHSFDKEPVFERDLEQVMTRSDHHGLLIPKLLMDCFDYLSDNNTVQGIFRISGAVSEVQKLKMLYNNGDHVDLEHCDVHTVASLTKLFFREMPDPLFKYELYDGFVTVFQPFDAHSKNVDEDEKDDLDEITNHMYVDGIVSLLNRLPKIHYLVAKKLFQLLHQVQKKSDVNMMTSRNLAIVFGPNILKSRNDNPMMALRDNGLVVRVVETLIMECDTIFEN